MFANTEAPECWCFDFVVGAGSRCASHIWRVTIVGAVAIGVWRLIKNENASFSARIFVYTLVDRISQGLTG